MKRRLTPKEIESMTSFLKPNEYIPKCIANAHINNMKEMINSQLEKIEIYPDMIPHLKSQLEQNYHETQIQAGECVGVLTAQCIGEKQTQSNLNSVIGSELICVKQNEDIQTVQIGQWIDQLMSLKQIQIHGYTEEVEMDTYYEVPTVDENGKMSWKQIEAVTRHPPLDKDLKVSNLIFVKTSSGCTVTATKAKSFLVRINNKIVPIEGSLLKLGDRLPVAICFDTCLQSIQIKKELLSPDNILEDVFFDPIVELKEVEPPKYVYDLTVADTRNFGLYNRLLVRDTFHKAGSSDKQPVVSKFAELLNATSKPKVPTFLIYFNTGNSSVKELRQTIGHSIVQITIEQITKEIIVGLNKSPESWYSAYFISRAVDYNEWKTIWQDCLTLKVNMDTLFEYKLSLGQIAEKINTTYSDMFCIHSPDNFAQLDIYVDTNVDLEEHKLAYITEENKRQVYLEEVVYPSIESLIVAGISGVLEQFFVQDLSTKTWYIETQNIKDKPAKKRFKVKNKPIDSVKRFKTVLGLPIVDMKKTISNNVWDILYTLGIEAVRAYMIDAFSQIMDGINLCHISILVDKMTFSGSISSISRYGMRKDDSGVLNRASFEETLDNLLNAGAFCQDDPINGVSASIICGKIPQIGTGQCDLTMNLNKLGVIDEEVDYDDEKEEVAVN